MSYSLFEDFVRYCGNVKKLKELEWAWKEFLRNYLKIQRLQ
jgi:hypothetical protein